MKRPILVRSCFVARTLRVRGRHTECAGYNAGFTLVEILVATTLALLLMGAVAVMFGRVAESITDSRSMLEAADRLRLAQTRLQMDLAGITATVCPPLKPENNEGYFEYIEGPALTNSLIAVNSDVTPNTQDQTVGDFDDILMFTTRTTGKPFVGRYYNLTTSTHETIQSDVAEVAWFLRGRTLHRRVLLVAPNVTFPGVLAQGYYANYDISARWDSGINSLRANTLGDLTHPQRRFAHLATALLVPSDVRLWHWMYNGYTFPTLPTIRECSGSTVAAAWSTEQTPCAATPPTMLDFWINAFGYRVPDNAYATGGTRVSDDVILTNVIGFDVKAWDPDQGAYVDLGYVVGGAAPLTGLGHYGQIQSQLAGSSTTARVYDTWSTTYFGNLWADGLDLNNSGAANGIVDDDTEKLNPPPYPIPLRGIQVKIRVFEPDSRQVREVTVVQDFLPR